MRAVVVMFDSLNRHFLPNFGCDWTIAPNFRRLAQRTVTFDRSYVCSMPCMPARRDFHTGRPNFLHRSWGPLEPFDDSVPAMLQRHGVSTHLVSDHYHYWEEGGSNYHTKYSTWQFFRGQEGDPWIGQVQDPPHDHLYAAGGPLTHHRRQDEINRQFMTREEDQPQAQTFAAGLDFIRRNHDQDNWLLHIETFDPHEPFFSQRKYKDLYAEHYARWRAEGRPQWDWPGYKPVDEPAEFVEHMRHEYAALVSMCDSKLGDVLDAFDRYDLWKDTLLVVWTDHGFLLGEHDCWAKCWMPFWEEVAHTPFWVWDPRCGKRGERRSSLVQPAIDLGPTLLDFFGLQPTEHMTGRVLRDAVATDQPVREAALFGLFGGMVNVTDGRYVYMRGIPGAHNGPLNQYTLMPANMRTAFTPEQFTAAEMHPPFAFTKGARTMRIAVDDKVPIRQSRFLTGSLFYDLDADPQQRTPRHDAGLEKRMIELMRGLMRQADAPVEQYQRLGIA